MAKLRARGVAWSVMVLGLALLSPQGWSRTEAAPSFFDVNAEDRGAEDRGAEDPNAFRLDDAVAVTRSLVIEVELDDE